MWKMVVVLASCLLFLPLGASAKEAPLVLDVAMPDNTVVKPTDVVQLTYTIRLDQLNGQKEAVLDLPVGVLLQKKTEQSFEDDRGNKGTVFFEDDVNQVHFIMEDDAYFYDNKTMTLSLPVLMDNVTLGEQSLVVQTAEGDKTLPYTIAKIKAAGDLNVTQTVDGAFIHWTVKMKTTKEAYRASRFVTTLSSDQQLEGPVHVKYVSLKTGTSYDEHFSIRPTAENEMKLNVGNIEEQTITMTFKTKAIAPSSIYTTDVALTSTNQKTLEAQGVAKATVQTDQTAANDPAATPNNATPSTTNTEPSNDGRGKTTNEDVIVTNTEETEMTELPQTGERSTVWGGVSLLVMSSFLFWKRRKTA